MLTTEELARLSYNGSIDDTYVSFELDLHESVKFIAKLPHDLPTGAKLPKPNPYLSGHVSGNLQNNYMTMNCSLGEYMKILVTLTPSQDFIKITNPTIYIQQPGNTGVSGVLGSRGPTDTVYNSVEKKLFMGVLRDASKAELMTEAELRAISVYESDASDTTIYLGIRAPEYIRLLTILHASPSDLKNNPIKIDKHSYSNPRGPVVPQGTAYAIAEHKLFGGIIRQQHNVKVFADSE